MSAFENFLPKRTAKENKTNERRDGRDDQHKTRKDAEGEVDRI